MKVIIGGDIVATERNLSLFEQGDMIELIGTALNQRIQECDIRIFNIEAPITDIESPILKCGPCLRMPSVAIHGLQCLNPTVVTLANNHIMDQGEQGFINTTVELEKAGIPYVGAGKNIVEARKGYYIKKDGMVLGVYACAEHEFSIADKNKAGANPFEPLDSLDDIAEVKKHCDYLIVLYHGGKEFYRYPSPYIQKVFHRMADKGADMVIAQHTHCIGCQEKYRNALLIYGQGNFIFDRGNDEYWNSGMLIHLDIGEGQHGVEYIPFYKKENGRIIMADEAKGEELMTQFMHRSEQIMGDSFVARRYTEFAEESKEQLLRVLHGNNLLFKMCNKLIGGGLVHKLYNPNAVLATLNFVECEAHRELIITALKNNAIN